MPRTEASPVTPTPLSRRRTSASVVLRSVLEHGPVARSTIARLTGLSPASVTDYCARFAELGLIRESAVPRRSNGVGRPHVPVDLDDSRFRQRGAEDRADDRGERRFVRPGPGGWM